MIAHRRSWPDFDMIASDGIEILTATERDLDGILALQEVNQPERGGTLSARLSRAQLEAMLRDLPPLPLAESLAPGCPGLVAPPLK